MKRAPLTRRGFLRLAVIAVGSAVAVACQQKLQEIATATSLPSPTATAGPTLKLDLGTNLDAWTWVKQVKVGVAEGECERVVLHVNGQQVEAQPEGDSFTAD